ncbi:YnfU family zinc-binding protein [Winslowiella toletana]|uniref:YnfU family zinc-binding protein n=1 Tax=Winslowiella toletana TaxID=92490 RepID=UPI0008FBF139|nr:YnfU family zinc-binding protein [Winslowiella toletana]
MINLDSLLFFRSGTRQIKCPACAHSHKQLAAKVSKNQTLICPHCGHYFTAAARNSEKTP